MSLRKPRFWGLRSLAELLDAPDGSMVWVENLDDVEPATWTCRRRWDGEMEVSEDEVGRWSMDGLRRLPVHDPGARDMRYSADALDAFSAICFRAMEEGTYPKPKRANQRRS